MSNTLKILSILLFSFSTQGATLKKATAFLQKHDGKELLIEIIEESPEWKSKRKKIRKIIKKNFKYYRYSEHMLKVSKCYKIKKLSSKKIMSCFSSWSKNHKDPGVVDETLRRSILMPLRMTKIAILKKLLKNK